jgi:hypothetical protein
LYDLSTGTFTLTGSMSPNGSQHTATLLNNGTVLAAGGGSPRLVSAELYDLATGTFTPTSGSMSPADRCMHTATLLQNGMVLIAGGNSSLSGLPNGQALFSAELYDPTAGTFTLTGRMNTSRERHTATLLNNGTVLIAGVTTASADLIVLSCMIQELGLSLLPAA